MSIFKKTLILIISILSLLLFSGCNKTISISNIKKWIVDEFTSSSKKKIKNRDKKITKFNKAISEKNIEVIYDQMSDELKEHGDKLRSKLKKFVNFFPGEIVETNNCSWGSMLHSERYKKAPSGIIEKMLEKPDEKGFYCYTVKVYRLSYNAIDDQGVEYDIAMEYIKSNEANPGEIGLNYVEIRKLDSDGKNSSLWKLVLHGSKFENDVES